MAHRSGKASVSDTRYSMHAYFTISDGFLIVDVLQSLSNPDLRTTFDEGKRERMSKLADALIERMA